MVNQNNVGYEAEPLTEITSDAHVLHKAVEHRLQDSPISFPGHELEDFNGEERNALRDWIKDFMEKVGQVTDGDPWNKHMFHERTDVRNNYCGNVAPLTYDSELWISCPSARYSPANSQISLYQESPLQGRALEAQIF